MAGRRSRQRWCGAIGLVVVLVPSASALASDARNDHPVEQPATATDLRTNASYNSPQLAADPAEKRFVAMADRLDNPDFGCALQVSGDGGDSWEPTQPVPRLPLGAEKCYAPEVAFDRTGKLYYLFVGLVGIGNTPMGVFLTSSTDRARSFSEPRMILGASSYMVRMALDANRGSLGRLHLTWLRVGEATSDGLGPTDNPIMSTYSDDGGLTYSPPERVSDPLRQRVVAPAMALLPGGLVAVAYFDLQADARDYQGLEGPTWEGHWSLVVATSTDGGRHFGPGVSVSDSIAPPGRVMLIYTMPPPALAVGEGKLYTAWADAQMGDPDIRFSASGNEGHSWSTPRRVNDDDPRIARDQSLPHISVATGGRIDLVFYDRRGDPADIANSVYYTYSTDHGRTFTPNRRLTTESSDSRIGQRYLVPSAQGLFDYGSRLGVLSTSKTVVVAWADTRNARVGTPVQQIFSMRLNHLGRHESSRAWIVVTVIGGSLTFASAIFAVFHFRRRQHRLLQPDDTGRGGPPASEKADA